MTMNSRIRAGLLAASMMPIIALVPPPARAQEQYHSVARASCGPQDRVESGLQGQTTLAERFAPGPARSYSCNLELVGQYEGEGSAFGMNVFGNCAYYSTWQNPKMKHPGVTVLDVTDPGKPYPTAYLDSPAMLSANENLEFDVNRRILLASKWPTTTGAPFDVYDLTADCRHPVLLTSISIPHMQSHAGEFVSDGRTFYGTASGDAPDPASPPSAVFAINMSDASHPHGLATWIPAEKEWQVHGVRVKEDGTRAYVALSSFNPSSATDGLVILDTRDIQLRRPNPQFHVISSLLWGDAQGGQFALPVTINGRPYIIFTDVAGAIPVIGSRSAGVCDSGRPGHGFARIIDIDDEHHPKVVSKVMLETALPQNCSKVVNDPTILGYAGNWCDVDNHENAKLLACGFNEAGLRVFDIRDPSHPSELAYYKPPARREVSRPGSPFSQTGPQLFPVPGPVDHTADAVESPRFQRDGQEIWFNSFDNGFQVVRFTDRFRRLHADLFRH
jgi:hypothetical protein